MRKLKFSIYVLFIFLISVTLSGCSESSVIKKTKDQKALAKTAVYESEKKNSNLETVEIHLNKLIPQKMFYTNKKVSVWANQMLFIKGGDASGQLVEGADNSKTKIILNYVKDEEIKEIQLTDLALKYNFYGGIKHINASPNGNYIAIEMGTTDNNKTVLIDTSNDKASIIWYDEKNQNSVINVSWKNDNDFIFAFFPSLDSSSVEKYNLHDNSINKIGDIEDKKFISEDNIIQWTDETIIVIDTNGKKIYQLKQ